MPDPHAPRNILRKPRRFRGAVLRGLSVILPPILTIVILVWIASTIDAYILAPVQSATRETMVWAMADVREAPSPAQANRPKITIDGEQYVRLDSGQFVPEHIVTWLSTHEPNQPLPTNGHNVYRRYIETRFLQPEVVIPVFVCLFVLILYFLGKFLAGEIGRLFDWGILRLPLVRKVYASVKQVTDFVFGEQQPHVEFKRVVVIEYPRKGLWSIGLVTGEGMLDVSSAANEPCVSIVLPTSPAIFTVKTVMVPKSKAYDVNMTIDQALQFVISCGVVVPPHQLPSILVDKTAIEAPADEAQ